MEGWNKWYVLNELGHYKQLQNPEQVNIVPINFYGKFPIDSLGPGIYLETEVEVEVEREVNWQ